MLEPSNTHSVSQHFSYVIFFMNIPLDNFGTVMVKVRTVYYLLSVIWDCGQEKNWTMSAGMINFIHVYNLKF